MHVFISYAKRDTYNLAQRIRRELEAIPGVTAWMDESLETGKSWAKQIQREIVNCDCFVVLLSPDVNRDETPDQPHSFVINEIQLAQELKKPIIPVMAQVTTRPVQIITLQYIDFSQNQAAGIQRLIADVKSYLPKSAPTPSSAPVVKPMQSSVSHNSEPAVKSSPVKPAPQPVSKPTNQPLSTPAKPVVKQEVKVAKPSSASPLVPLVAWNPLSWLRLLWWVMIKPVQYQAYLDQYGESQLRPTAAALVSTLIWLSPLIITLGAVTTTVPFDVKKTWDIAAVVWLLLIILGWVVTILLENRVEQLSSLVFGAMGFMAFMVASSGTYGITSGAAGGWMGVVAGGVVFGLATRLANGPAAFTAGGVALGVVFGLTTGLQAIIVILVAFFVSKFIQHGIKTGSSNFWHSLILVVLVGDYAALIYIFLLGGYQVPA